MLLLMTNRKSRAFDWCQNQEPWVSLNGHYALCFKIHAFSEPTQKLECRQNYIISGKDKVYADICGGSLERGHQVTVGFSKMAIFSPFTRYFFRSCRGYNTLLYTII